MKLLLHVLILSVTLIACEKQENERTYYDNGNLRLTKVIKGDTSNLTYYHDDEQGNFKKAEIDLVNDSVQSVTYYNKLGEIVLESTLSEKKLFEIADTSGVYFGLDNPSFDYFSLKLSKPFFTEDLPGFFENIVHSDGYGVLLNDSTILDSPLDLLVFEYNLYMLNDSIAGMKGNHAYVSFEK